jgi:hypothetical protein
VETWLSALSFEPAARGIRRDLPEAYLRPGGLGEAESAKRSAGFGVVVAAGTIANLDRAMRSG